MKKLLSSSLVLATLFFATGCLKDKGFDNHQYGINDPDKSPAGITFPLALNTKVTRGLEVSATPQTISNTVMVNLEFNQPAPADIKVNLGVDNTIISNYNAANGTNIQVLAPSLYSLGSTTITIKKGERLATVPLVVNNTTTLDPTKSYGVALTIASVDPGYTIASNLKNLLVEITIKNKYDGLYRLQGVHNRVPYNFPYDVRDIELRTKGANQVEFYWRAAGDVGHPIGVGPGSTNWYGPTVAPVIVFNTTTDLVTDVYNQALSAGGPPINIYTGAGSGQGRAVGYGVIPGATKTIYVYWRYNNNDLRAFMDTLTYLGPR